MSDLTPPVPGEPTRVTTKQFLRFVASGELTEDDRVELLAGVLVAVPPSDPPHASAVTRAVRALARAVGGRACIRPQCPFVAGPWSVPEPDVAVVPGSPSDYDTAHPREALLLVEVAASSLPQDRISKARIYAAAGVPELWIVNLRDGVVEVMRAPDPPAARYRTGRVAQPGESLEPVALPGARLAVSELLPGH